MRLHSFLYFSAVAVLPSPCEPEIASYENWQDYEILLRRGNLTVGGLEGGEIFEVAFGCGACASQDCDFRYVCGRSVEGICFPYAVRIVGMADLPFLDQVVLGGLKAGPSWFVADHLLISESRCSDPHQVAREIAVRNDLRWERVEDAKQSGYTFYGIE